ncbi:MAG: hypothetical protein E7214_05265 [Clostridium sp.]|nr:hypothetical protein [Clostridium sp.]
MPKERILSKKFEQLDKLKLALISRSDMSKEEIVDKIKDTVDELEIILEDFNYINNTEEDRFLNMRGRDRIYDTDEKADGKEFTLDELAKYDGKEGRPAYLAIDGIVYNMEKVPAWNLGEHNGMEAGKDMTRSFYQVHHKNVNVLDKADIVGIIVES